MEELEYQLHDNKLQFVTGFEDYVEYLLNEEVQGKKIYVILFQTIPFMRLNLIYQGGINAELGRRDKNRKEMMYTRFEHSIAAGFVSWLLAKKHGYSREKIIWEVMIALCHDIGHTAFSHLSDLVLNDEYHGTISARMMQFYDTDKKKYKDIFDLFELLDSTNIVPFDDLKSDKSDSIVKGSKYCSGDKAAYLPFDYVDMLGTPEGFDDNDEFLETWFHSLSLHVDEKTKKITNHVCSDQFKLLHECSKKTNECYNGKYNRIQYALMAMVVVKLMAEKKISEDRFIRGCDRDIIEIAESDPLFQKLVESQLNVCEGLKREDIPDDCDLVFRETNMSIRWFMKPGETPNPKKIPVKYFGLYNPEIKDLIESDKRYKLTQNLRIVE